MRVVAILFCAAAAGWAALPATSQPTLRMVATTVRADGRAFPVKVVKAKLGQARFRLGLAQGRVGATESLEGIARRYGAAAAINGSFFEAYTSDPVKVPNHTLVTGGQVVHKGNIGSLVAFTADGRAFIDRVPLRIKGGLDGSNRHPHNWYAYWINRPPTMEDSVNLFTPHWGKETGLSDGVQVTVSNGVITGRGVGSQPIPRDGYVICLRGSEKKLAERLRTGRSCAYWTEPEKETTLPWEEVREAVGAGPRLVVDGRVSVDAVAEDFRDPKILTLSGARSMVGLTADGWVLLATSSGTVRQMAPVMRGLGAVHAMNLDGGASSGLWAQGRTLTRTGRAISNALLVFD